METASRASSSFLYFSPASKFADTNLIVFYTILTVLFTVSFKYEMLLVKYLNVKLKNILQNSRLIKTTGSVSKSVKLKRLTNMAKTFFTTHTIYRIKSLNKNFITTKYKKYLTLRTQFNTKFNKYSYDKLFYIAKYKHNKTIKSSINDDFDCTSSVSAFTTTNSWTKNKIASTLAVTSAANPLESTSKIYNSRVKFYKKLPLRAISRLWGTINAIDLPVWCRKPCFLLYSWLFNCNLNEMDIEDLTHYKNLSEFFRRKLKPDARVIDTKSSLVCPCDGRVLHFGVCDKGYVEQVKGVNYSLKAFLGENNWSKSATTSPSDEVKYENTLKHNPNNELYHCIIYLAPGDYHRFHSPGDWEVFFRRHFPGELFSVNPSVARWLQGLFNLNERAVYYGKWTHGFFSMTAVGATNVGSIMVPFDPLLETNRKTIELDKTKLDKSFDESSVKMTRGDYFGEFNLGSTIVLVFEAPKEFQFQIKQNQKVFYGEPLGSL